MALADLVVVMNEGRIEQQGAPREVFNRPRTAFVARFIGGHNVIAMGATTLAVRADRLHVSRLAGSNGVAVTATVTGVEFQGAFVHTSLLADDGTELVAMAPEHTLDRDPLEAGVRVGVSWDADGAHALA
jgi:putative spermidine/putrescine transport system ATP-binding protein